MSGGPWTTWAISFGPGHTEFTCDAGRARLIEVNDA